MKTAEHLTAAEVLTIRAGRSTPGALVSVKDLARDFGISTLEVDRIAAEEIRRDVLPLRRRRAPGRGELSVEDKLFLHHEATAPEREARKRGSERIGRRGGTNGRPRSSLTTMSVTPQGGPRRLTSF